MILELLEQLSTCKKEAKRETVEDADAENREGTVDRSTVYFCNRVTCPRRLPTGMTGAYVLYHFGHRNNNLTTRRHFKSGLKMVDSSVEGLLQLKQVTSSGETWTTYLSEYHAPTKTLECKSEDGQLLYVSMVIDGAWALEQKPGRREGRFDVLTSNGATVAFAAAREEDMQHWVEVLKIGALSGESDDEDDKRKPVLDEQSILKNHEEARTLLRASSSVGLSDSAANTSEADSWRAAFTATSKTSLEKAEFMKLTRSVLESESAASQPSDADLDAAFTVADEDGNGVVDEDEFVRLMRLVKKGELSGLGSPGWFQRSKMEAKFKSQVAAEKAADAQAAALAMAKAASEAATAAMEAANAAIEKRRIATVKAMVAPTEDQVEQDWRKKFAAATNGKASKELEKPEFKALVKKILVRELMKMTDLAQPGDPPLPPPPLDADLDAAFKVADANKSGLVDEEEFVKLMRLIKAGKVSGLGDTGFFGFGGGNKQKQFKKDLELARKLEAANKAAKFVQQQLETPYEDDDAAAEAKAAELSEKAKLALAEAKTAQAAAAESAAKAQAREGQKGLAAEGPTSTIGGDEPEVNNGKEEELQGAKDSYADLSELMNDNGLSDFVAGLHKNGVDLISELKGCTDAWLVQKLSMKAAHVVKFRRALRDPKASAHFIEGNGEEGGGSASVFEAIDGFRGTHEECVRHEAKLQAATEAAAAEDAKVVMHLYEAPDGFRGTYEDVVAHERKLGLAKGHEVDTGKSAKFSLGHGHIMHLYKAPDGFMGTYEEVLAHEKELGIVSGDELDMGGTGSYATEDVQLYEAPDGFRGTYEEVVAYEAEHGFDQGDEHAVKVKPEGIEVYSAPDGYMGTYEEVLAYEKKMGMATGNEVANVQIEPHHDRVLLRIYEAPDGFRGTYDEVEEHEAKVGIEKGSEHAFTKNEEEIYKAPDGFMGTYEEVLEHEKMMGVVPGHKSDKKHMYEAPDGFRGTYEEVVAHEKEMGLDAGNEADMNEHMYEASDGFRGSYEEVLAYEKEHGLDQGAEHVVDENKKGEGVHIYKAPDGFIGTYEEVLAHEEKLGMTTGEEVDTEEVLVTIYEAPDGFRGTYDEVLAHEKKLGMATGSEHTALNEDDGQIYMAPDGFMGTYGAVLAHEQTLGLKSLDAEPKRDYQIYKATDGFHGTYDEVVAHEIKFGLEAGNEVDTGTTEQEHPHMYEAPDGFRGTYEEVAAYEAEHGFDQGAENMVDEDSKRETVHIYKAPDGFMGTYEEVLAHEKKLGISTGSEQDVHIEERHDRVLLRIYEAPDGFRGTYDEVEEHEAKTGMAKGLEHVVEEIYKAPDGFMGTYEEVLAYEEKMGLGGEESKAGGMDNHQDELVYVAPDGFQGTYEEVLAYEKERGFDQGAEHIANGKMNKYSEGVAVFKAPDGFHGTYDEVVAHEKKIGRKFCENTGKEIPLSTHL